MTTFGYNLKLSVDASHRAHVRAFFAEALQSKQTSPGESFDVFVLADGFNIGVFYVPADKALTTEQYERSAWLEFAVGDPAAVTAALRAHNVERVPHADGSHEYYRVPGGPVFRLTATRAS